MYGFPRVFKILVQDRPSWVFPWIAVGPAILNILILALSLILCYLAILYPESE